MNIIIKSIKNIVIGSILFISPYAYSQCIINAGNFFAGQYDPLSLSDLTSTSSISIDCQSTQEVTVSADGGNSGTPLTRYLVNIDGDKLYYNLYLSFNGANIFGDGLSTSKYSGKSGSIPIYFKASSNQDIGVGFYTDNLIINVDF